MASLTRRGFLKAGGVALAASGFAASCRVRKEKPNLLFLWTDEQRPDTMAAYGNALIHTPNLNRLAAESVVFERAYCTQPVCTPARASVLTGLWPHQTGCLHNNISLPTSTKAFPELLDDADYRTGYMGKWHLGDEIFAQHGFEEWVSTEDSYVGNYSEGRDRSARSDYNAFLRDAGYEPDVSNNFFSREFCARRPFEHCKPEFLAERACDFLRRHRNAPFILHVNYLEPHMPFYGPLDDLHDPEQVPVPPSLDDPLEENEPLRYRIFQKWYYENGWDGEELKTEADWRAMIAKYWGLVSQVDHSVGRILTCLDELGLSENTIVVFTSDHGEMMGAHRLFTKTYSYEESAGVPLLVRLPGHTGRQVRFGQPVSQIDLVPTLIDLMHGDAGNYEGPGQSLAPLLAGQELEQDHVFVQWNSFYQDLTLRCRPETRERFTEWLEQVATPEEVGQAMRSQWRSVIAPDGWKLTLADGDKHQLFHLKDDPLETTNLFGQSQYDEVVSRLTKKIHAWQESVDDTVPV